MRAAGMLYTITFISALLATQNFSVPKPGKPVEEEQHYRLLSIFAKNKYGYNTRFMSDFEQFLEAITDKLGNKESREGITRIFELFDDDRSATVCMPVQLVIIADWRMHSNQCLFMCT